MRNIVNLKKYMAKLKESDIVVGTYYFKCPGCKASHYIPTKNREHPNWGFNGNLDAPTFTPSILVTSGKYVKDQGEESRKYYEEKNYGGVCHSFVSNGFIQFLTDCTHELKGQTVELPEMP